MSSTDSRLLGVTAFQTYCAVLAALGTLNFGWNNGDINIPGDVISKCVTGPLHYNGRFPSCIPTDGTIWGVAVGCLSLGAWVGGMVAGITSNKYGRKPSIMYGNIFAIIGALLISTTTSLGQFIAGRLVLGLQAGAATACVSTYIGEITTPKARTVLGAMLQLSVNVGIFLSQALSLGLSKPPLWRVLFAISGVISIISMVFLPAAVESPKWLVSKGRVDEARSALVRLRKGADVELELQDMIDANSSTDSKDSIENAGVLDLLLNRTRDNLIHQVIVVSALMFFQQLSGINAVVFYSTKIFDKVSTSDPANIPTLAQILSMVISLVAAIFTFIGMFLISRFGRRTLMMFSHGCMAVASLLMAVGSIKNVNALVIIMVFVFNITFNFGVGPLPWAAAAEMTPAYAMAAMTSIGNSINFIFTFVIGVIFPPLQASLGDYTFFFFMAFNIAAFIFVFLFLPETKDRRVEDVVRVHATGFHVVLGRTVPIVGETEDIEDSKV